MPGLVSHWPLILIVLVIVLIIWGPGKLPDVGAGMGRAIREFRKASTETRDSFMQATSDTPVTTPGATPVTMPGATAAPPPPAAPAPPAGVAQSPPPAPDHSAYPPHTPVSG